LKLGELVESVSQGLTAEGQSEPQEQTPPAQPPTAQEPFKEVHQSIEPQTKQVQAQVSSAQSTSATAVQQAKQQVADDSRLQKRSSVFGSFKQKMSEALELSEAEPEKSQQAVAEESSATIKKSKFGLASVTNRVASATKSLKDAASTLISIEDEPVSDQKAQTGDEIASPSLKKGSNTIANTNSSQSGSRKSVFGRLSIMSNSVLGSLETVKNEMLEQVVYFDNKR